MMYEICASCSVCVSRVLKFINERLSEGMNRYDILHDLEFQLRQELFRLKLTGIILDFVYITEDLYNTAMNYQLINLGVL